MYKTTFRMSKMDCSSEESLVRMKLETRDDLLGLRFHLSARLVELFHEQESSDFQNDLSSLRLGAEKIDTVQTEVGPEENEQQKHLLQAVLAINAIFFVGESVFGFLANSMGLVADSLDMLADSIVYGLSLMAVGKAVSRKKTVARWSGYFQLGLALLGLGEIIRRFLYSTGEVDYKIMMIVAFVALLANGFCLYLLRGSKSDEAHMRASEIFTSNDIVINLGVITAGGLVYALESRVPDLVVGTVVFLVVLHGARRILKLSE
jgi:Co/Zn/Cd efflux system component